MKFLIPVALLALSSSFVSADLEDEALWMIACSNKSMSLGLPAAGIPVHLPSVKFTDRSFKLPLGVGDLFVSLNGAEMTGIPYYYPPQVSGVSDGVSVNYKYSITWPEFVIKGHFDWNITALFFGELAGQHAEFSFRYTNVTFSGVWNMVLPVQTNSSWRMPSVTKFTLNSAAVDTETELKGLGLINSVVKASLDFGAHYLFNHFPAALGEALTVRFNTHWLNPNEAPQPLLALLDNCGLNFTSVA